MFAAAGSIMDAATYLVSPGGCLGDGMRVALTARFYMAYMLHVLQHRTYASSGSIRWSHQVC
jgi:hypothetical protein